MIRIVAAGDVMLGRNVGAALLDHPPAYVWGDTLPLLRAGDVTLVNLECVIAGEEIGSPWTPRKVFYFKAPPEAIGVLQAASVTAVTLANNHTLDFHYEALEEMLRLLEGAGIAAAGAGLSQVEARRVVSLDARGLRIGLVGFTDNEPDWEAGAGLPGVSYVPIDLEDSRALALVESIRVARAAHDLIIVSAHWGPNMLAEPLPQHGPFARALAEAGADLFIGHSAHVVQGIEVYRPQGRPGRAVPICYDLGDYLDDYAVDSRLRNDRSFLFTFEAGLGGVSRIYLHPVLIDGWRCQVNLTGGREAQESMAAMADRCRNLGTAVSWVEGRLLVDVAGGLSPRQDTGILS